MNQQAIYSSDAHADRGGSSCPACGGDDVEKSLANAAFEAGDVVAIGCRCMDCHATWRDEYVLDGYSCLEDKDRNPIDEPSPPKPAPQDAVDGERLLDQPLIVTVVATQYVWANIDVPTGIAIKDIGRYLAMQVNTGAVELETMPDSIQDERINVATTLLGPTGDRQEDVLSDVPINFDTPQDLPQDALKMLSAALWPPTPPGPSIKAGHMTAIGF